MSNCRATSEPSISERKRERERSEGGKREREEAEEGAAQMFSRRERKLHMMSA